MIAYTIPRSFKGHRGIIQRNAVRSWLSLGLDAVFVGRDPGVQGVAERLGALSLPCARTEKGTPLVREVFRYANQEPGVKAYFNADCIFMDDLMPSVREVASRFEDFLIIGRRWDVDLRYELVFDGNWQDEMRAIVELDGSLHGPQGVEYFIWRGEPFTDMPPFAVGRPGYDNWMVWWAVTSGWPVIDATGRITCVHQDHDRKHRRSEEARINRSMVSKKQRYGVWDATHSLGG